MESVRNEEAEEECPRGIHSHPTNNWLLIFVCFSAFVSVLLSYTTPRPSSINLGHGGHVVSSSHVSESMQQQRFHPRSQPHHASCSGHGSYEPEEAGVHGGSCRCHSCFTGETCADIVPSCAINFDHGDPKMFEHYWRNINRGRTRTVLQGGERMSYFSSTDAICWFLEPALAVEVTLIHKIVGNAITDGHHIVVGTGSSQLIHAALHALSSASTSSMKPLDVVSAAPYYSSYAPMTDYLQSGLHKWAGDALSYESKGDRAYIEFVTSPGNPDGMYHTPVVQGSGTVIYDLAYYWPQYTPILYAADHDIMLFTFSKSTGYAGTRLGWALVRDSDIAKRMTKYIELNTIGVSKDSQIHASQILKVVRQSYDQVSSNNDDGHNERGLFDFGYAEMRSRWMQLRAAINQSQCFTISDFPSGYCTFFRKETTLCPAFAWLKCEQDVDCHAFFKANGILTRSGVHFGSSPQHVRISMVDHQEVFQLFITRLKHISGSCGLN